MQKFDLSNYKTPNGVLEKLFFWKFPSRYIAYKDFDYRFGACPACGFDILAEYGPSHSFGDYKRAKVSLRHTCIFCGFYSTFERNMGVDNFNIHSTLLQQFSQFKTDRIIRKLKNKQLIAKLFNALSKQLPQKEKISCDDFIALLSSEENGYDFYAPEPKGDIDFKIIYICKISSGITYALKVSQTINLKTPSIEPVGTLLYPKILWEQKEVKFVFDNDLYAVYPFEEAYEILTFLRCYNTKYPPFYKMSDEMIKQILTYNATYYYETTYFAGQTCQQSQKEIKFKDEVIYSVSEV